MLTAIIPIKENSERVPQKNFRFLNGKPLFHHILDTLSKIKIIDEIRINTDAPQRFEKLEIPNLVISRRPEDLCGDFVDVNRILKYEIALSKNEFFFMTHTTNPLLSTQTIINMIDKFFESNHDSLFCVNSIKARLYREDLTTINHSINELIRTQDLPVTYIENSIGYVFSKESFNDSGRRIGKNPGIFETPPLESFDIDIETDWFVVESLMQRLVNN